MDVRRLSFFVPGDSEWIIGLGRVALAVIFKRRKKGVGFLAVEIGWVFKDIITLAHYPVCMILRISVWNALATNEIQKRFATSNFGRQGNKIIYAMLFTMLKPPRKLEGLALFIRLKTFCDKYLGKGPSRLSSAS